MSHEAGNDSMKLLGKLACRGESQVYTWYDDAYSATAPQAHILKDHKHHDSTTCFVQRKSAGPTCRQEAASHDVVDVAYAPVPSYNYHPHLWSGSDTSLVGGLETIQGNLSLKVTHLYRLFGLGTGQLFMVTMMCMIFDWVKNMISTTSMIRQCYYYDYYDNSQYY